MDAKKRISEILNAKKDIIFDCNDKIWEFAETRFDTPKSADEFCRILTQEGFQVERGIAHMENAFVATCGSGKPVIGILAEYDSLANLSQIADLPEKKQLAEGGNGHGCGHNSLGSGSLAGAIGIKDYMEESGLTGTIKFFGCPAEESGYGKAFLSKAGAFNCLDAALTWHPGDVSGVWSTSSLAVAQVYFNFKGISAHAAAAPEMGRSALDAAELMNVGVNFLREHIIDQARIHYAFIDAGGVSANVVQSTSSLYYFIRAPRSEQVLELYKRVEKIARGAALMTETEVEVIWDSACANYVPNSTLTHLVYDNMSHYVPLDLTEEEMAYEKKFYDTLDTSIQAANAARAQNFFGDLDSEGINALATSPVLNRMIPYNGTLSISSGSTDVGDVSWVTPTAQFMLGYMPQGSPAHSWQWAATGKSSVAHKAALTAGKILAATVYDILTKPEILEKAKEDFKRDLNGTTYKSIIPDGVFPDK